MNRVIAEIDTVSSRSAQRDPPAKHAQVSDAFAGGQLVDVAAGPAEVLPGWAWLAREG